MEDILAIAETFHSAGPCSPRVLQAIDQRLSRRRILRSVETGAGASTLLFSHLSEHHSVFALDGGSGSIAHVRSSLLFNAATTIFVEGPTQETLPRHRFDGKLQVALLDGPHAFPFPQLEYYYIYPQLDSGALLIIDDIQIPSVHHLYRFLKADEMFRLVEVVERTAFFERTAAPLFDPLADGWQRQGYNRTPLLRYTWRERLREVVPEAIRRWKALHAGDVRIIQPRQGAKVGASGVVRGTARNRAGALLWVLARRRDQNGWWPQGEGPVDVRAGQWEQLCKYGESSDTGSGFEVVVVTVDADTNRRLERWVEERQRGGDSPPIPLPKCAGTSPARVSVMKSCH